MSRFDQANPIQIQPVSILRNDQPPGDVLPCDFLNNLRHSSGCFSSTYDNQPSFKRKQPAGDGKSSIRNLNRVMKTRGRIRGVQRGLPDFAGVLPKLRDRHPLGLYAPPDGKSTGPGVLHWRP
jgi:hypothetical protein